MLWHRLTGLVPSQRVLGHDRRTDHLGPVASQAVRRQTTTRSKDRTTTTAAFTLLLCVRARALVQLTSLAVATCHPEHSGTIGRSSTHDTDTNANGARTSG